MRKRPRPPPHASPARGVSSAARIAFSSSLIVTAIGTIWPSLMQLRINSPYSEPSRACSARRRSPAARGLVRLGTCGRGRGAHAPERWQKPKSSTRLAHCVPLPGRSRSGGMNTRAGSDGTLTHARPAEHEYDGHFAVEDGRRRGAGRRAGAGILGLLLMVLLVQMQGICDLVHDGRHGDLIADDRSLLLRSVRAFVVTRRHEGVVLLSRLSRCGISRRSVVHEPVECAERGDREAEKEKRIGCLVSRHGTGKEGRVWRCWATALDSNMHKQTSSSRGPRA